MKKYLLLVMLSLTACQHGHDAVNDQELMTLSWKKHINRGYENSDHTIIPVVGDFIWVGDSYGTIGAYSKSSGDLVWRKYLSHGLSATVAEDAGQLLFLPLQASVEKRRAYPRLLTQ